jgi:NADH:ubiquinone oxidoreductase subunit B-like Fe-S oxidoreductase
MKSAKAKTDKARYGAIIRSASKQANVTVTIMWSSSGVPQVVRTEKRK